MRYRPEIDGLRALAVLPVIFYHAGFSYFDGGFVGVDIFFVISGYLISSILLRESETGSISLVGFYERRARRILPALFLVVAACIPAAWMIMTPAEMKDFAQSALAVSVFLSNVFFWMESGYFDAASELKPLLHTWSLAVEEQFYIVFPVLLILVCKYRRTALVPILICLALVSLALSEWGWRNAPSGNFYLAFSRAWELLAGSLCAIALRRGIVGDELLAGIGVAMIATSIIFFDQATPFPSLYALLPVVGTALVILFADRNTIVGQVLSLKPFLGLGLISYSAYLWHQPLFVFTRLELDRDPSKPGYAVLIILTLVLSYLSWRYVEMPFRRVSGPNALTRRAVFTASVVVSAGMFAFGGWGHVSDGWRATYVTRLPADQRVMFTMAEDARQEHSANAKGRFDDGACVFDANSVSDVVRSRLRACAEEYGPGVLILGDSHAIDLYGAVIEAERSGKPFIAGIVSGGCRAHRPSSECSYDEIAALVASDPNIFGMVIYTQAGFYLLRGHGYNAGHRSMFAKFEPQASVPHYDPDLNRLIAVRDYLEGLSRYVPVAWLTPRTEPHISPEFIRKWGCSHDYQLRPGTQEVFGRLEDAIATLLDTSDVQVLAQSGLLNLSLPEDLLSCDALYWSDGDHFSNAGEERFGKRMKVLQAALQSHGLK